MAEKVKWAKAAGKDIIWDQTSTTIASRLKKFNMLPDYYKISVIFRKPDDIELKKRLDSRPGKTIPWNVIEQMYGNWEEPTLEEGFDEVWNT